MALGLATGLRNAMGDAITTYAGASAILRVYSGTRPATGGTPTTMLAQLTCNATFAPGASGGVVTLNAISPATSAAATGTAAWWRLVRSDGSTHIMDGAVSTIAAGTGDMRLDDTAIVLGGTVAISSATFTLPNA